MTGSDADAVVVGSGPNGLAAAVTLARAGLSVHVIEANPTLGGGARSAELTEPGLVHDVCSAFHPFGVASPFFSSLPLADHGLEWRWPDIDLAHPLDGGRAALLTRSFDETARSLGADGAAWRATFEPLATRFDHLADDVLRPLVGMPRHPVTLGRFGLRAVLSATGLARRFEDDEARALWAGTAAHVFRPLERPFTAAAGVMLTASAHAVGWPVARGGTQAITDALLSLLRSTGGTTETGRRVHELAELGEPRLVLLDTSPRAAAALLGDRLPSQARAQFRRYRYGPAAAKLDLAVEGGIPWAHPDVARAGTVHVGGTLEEIAAAEHATHRGRMPERPFVLVGQQAVCDAGRADADVVPIWAYAHVPHGHHDAATEAILAQIERFAPGTLDRIVARRAMAPAELEAANANQIGGDIAGGANSLPQLVFRPRVARDPYATGVDGVYLCSASTPPGAGVHGMCGHLAARSALRSLGV